MHPIDSDMCARLHREELLHQAATWRRTLPAYPRRRVTLLRLRRWWAARRRPPARITDAETGDLPHALTLDPTRDDQRRGVEPRPTPPAKTLV